MSAIQNSCGYIKVRCQNLYQTSKNAGFKTVTALKNGVADIASKISAYVQSFFNALGRFLSTSCKRTCQLIQAHPFATLIVAVTAVVFLVRSKAM